MGVNDIQKQLCDYREYSKLIIGAYKKTNNSFALRGQDMLHDLFRVWALPWPLFLLWVFYSFCLLLLFYFLQCVHQADFRVVVTIVAVF